jgi:carbon-monoxide dehydrogenase large subunit
MSSTTGVAAPVASAVHSQSAAMRLLMGTATFVGDRPRPGALHVAVLRSPHACARIAGIDLAPAKRRPGVVDAISFADIAPIARPIPLYNPSPALRPRTPFALAHERVRYVGEPVAAVLASDRYIAEDALEAIVVDYRVEPAVANLEDALRPGAPLVHPDLGSNLAAHVEGRVGDPDAAFRAAGHVTAVRLSLGRQSPQPLEPRGVAAEWDDWHGLTVWDSSQSAHMVRRILAYLLDLSEAQVRVVIPDVGGGFGGKNRFYPEEFLVAFFALRHRRPVQWLGDRREDLLAMYQEREQLQTGELALAADGAILGLRVAFVDNTGAYTPFGIVTSHMTAVNAMGPYRVPNYDYRYDVAYTHRVGMAPYRGAGRPQGTFLIERLLDRAAHDLAMDPAALRLRNLVTAAEQPYDTGLVRDGRRMIYDGGDYPAAYRRALEMIGYESFKPRQETARSEGRCLGVGTAVAIEVASPNTAEGARVTVDRSGRVVLYTGACSSGQGLETMLARVCADALGVDAAQVGIIMADTALMPLGAGTWASRTAVAAGNAAALAAAKVREKAVSLAAAFLEVAPGDLEVADGAVRVRGTPARAISLGALAEATTYPNLGRAWRWPLGKPFPWGEEPGLDATCFFRPVFTYGYAAHAAEVEADPHSGTVTLQKYVVVHDCGRVLNPVAVEGQVLGAVTQGVGAALLEEAATDESGQPLAASLMDYLMPTAVDAPSVVLEHRETAGLNPLGVKGAGEGGIIPVPAVICGAVDDALRQWSVFCDRIPLTPSRLWELIRSKRHATEGAACQSSP